MRKILIATLILTVNFVSVGQGKSKRQLKKAENYYEAYSYTNAIGKYADAQDGSIESLRNLAESFYRVGNTEKAENLYGQVVNQGTPTSDDVYRYASMLMQNKKYDEAAEMMKEFNALSPEDQRGVNYLSDLEFTDVLQKDKEQFTIENLSINSAQEDFAAVFFQDKVVFASSREGVMQVRRKWNWNRLPFLDLYQADKSSNGELMDAKQLQKSFNKRYHEGPVCFNDDETIMYFTRNNYKGRSVEGIIKLQIFSSKKEYGEWQNEVPFTLNSSEYSVGHPSISADGKWLYFASDMEGGYGGVDIYKIKINEDGTYGEASNLGDKINTEGNEMFPNIQIPGMIVYSSDGKPGLGGLDIFATQILQDESLGRTINFGVPVNSSRDDFSFVLNKEKKKGYFASNRLGGKGDDDIYRFDLLKPIIFGKVIEGFAKDDLGEPLTECVVEILDDRGNVLTTYTTDENGRYEFTVDPRQRYELKGTKDDYFDAITSVSTFSDDDIIQTELELERDPKLSLYILVTDKEDHQYISDVSMIIVDKITEERYEFVTDSTGSHTILLPNKSLNDRGNYSIEIEKEGYFPKTLSYSTVFDRPGVYNLHENLDFAMDKIEVGGDISKFIEINPIYFDFNKYNIRTDAAAELDKIVEIMNDYPGMEVELGSHTDSRGGDAYNIKLSDRRAKASAKYIKDKITNPERIKGKGYGETKLINKCKNGVRCSDEAHQENRRTEFIITKFEGDVKVKNNSPNSFE